MSDRLTNDLVSLIFAAGQMMRERVRKGAKYGPFTFVRAETLRFIKSHRFASMRELSDFLHIAPPSTTSLIDHLVKSGLIKRTSDAKDRRLTKLQITEKGDKLLENNFKMISLHLKNKLSALTEKDKRNFIDILKKKNQADAEKLQAVRRHSIQILRALMEGVAANGRQVRKLD